MSEEQTPMAEEIRKRSYLVRTEEQLRDALSRFCRGEVCMSIPVDYERDADMILSDGIKELMVLRKAAMADPEATITKERLKEIEERLKRLPGRDWYAEEDEHSWQLFAESEVTFHGPLGPISGHPWQLIKAPKKDTPYAEYWPTPEVSAFLTNARQDVPALLAEIHRLRAKVQEQDAEIKAARRNGDRTHRQLLDALTHPEDYTKIRATLLAREARIGPPPWQNVRSIAYPTTPTNDVDGARLRGGTFKTQDEYAKARGHNNFTITANPDTPTDTVLMVNHPMLVRAELVCARCGGWHRYMHQVIAIKDGIAGQPEWVGCTGEAPTDSTQGEGDTPS